MRLIDADKLIKRIEDLYNDTTEKPTGMTEVRTDATAYGLKCAKQIIEEMASETIPAKDCFEQDNYKDIPFDKSNIAEAFRMIFSHRENDIEHTIEKYQCNVKKQYGFIIQAMITYLMKGE